jgi:hypothetical protein
MGIVGRDTRGHRREGNNSRRPCVGGGARKCGDRLGRVIVSDPGFFLAGGALELENFFTVGT